MELKAEDRKLIFKKVELKFNEDFYENVYGGKNNKTLAETLKHSRYRKFRNIIYEKYSDYLDWVLGEFILMLKNKGDAYYKSFLNKYGDSTYSHFWIDDHSILDKKGLYVYKTGNDLKYIGRCLDNFQRRINLGYGKIHPKNCYLDGQATNCHLNSLITQNRDSVSLWICDLDDGGEIMELESSLISIYNPEWNIASVSSYNAIKPIKIAGGNKMVKVRRKENVMEGNEKFEEFWNELKNELSEEQTIRNWTADKGYIGKGDFKVICRGSNNIECDSPGAETIQKVPKKDFQIMYEHWNPYTIGNMGRADLRDKSRFTKYTMSILHQYEELM